MGIKFSNLASTTLASGITNSATTITVADGSVFPALGSGDFFFASIDTPPNSPEIVKVTAVSSNTLTVVRGQDGTTATTHASGEIIALRVVAATLEDLRDNSGETYTAGAGITLTGTVFSNAAPDQTVSLTGSGATTVSGTYPNFTISSTGTEYTAGSGITLTGTVFSNAAPDQTVALTGAGTTTISGTYPNFTITGATSSTSIDTMTGDGTTTALTLSSAPDTENQTAVYVDGVYQSKSNYSVSGTTLTFSTAPPSGSAVEVVLDATVSIGTPSDGTVTSAKLSGDLTTPGDLDVTGTVSADGLTVDGNVSVISALPRIILEENDATDLNTAIRNNGGVFKIQTVNDAANSFTNRMDINHSSGDVILYGNVGIGSSPDYNFHVTDTGDTIAAVTAGASSVAGLNLGNSSNKADGGIRYDNSADALILRASNAERLRITSAGVGIGISNPSEKLTVVNSSSGIVGRFTNNINQTLDLGVISGSGSAGGVYYNNANSGYHAFQIGGSEAARVDSNLNLLVGKNVLEYSSSAGIILRNDGLLSAVRDGGNVCNFTRLSSDGEIIQLNKGSTNVGTVGTVSNGLYIASPVSSDSGLRFSGSTVHPCDTAGAPRDNAVDLGYAQGRFDDIYATNGTIQTSDRNEKQDIEALSDAEQRVAVAAKGLLRKFRWISSVEENGDDARIHFGIIAQDLQDAFTAEGLDAGRYAMFINSTWTDEETGEERSRMGVRYSELLAFIISAI